MESTIEFDILDFSEAKSRRNYTSFIKCLKILLLIYFTQCFYYVDASSSNQMNSAKEKFSKDFQNKCEKYSFVKSYTDIIDKPPGRYLVYNKLEHGGGGLGDRLAGLVTAVAYSILYKRTLLIKDIFPDFEKYLKSYHPTKNINWDYKLSNKMFFEGKNLSKVKLKEVNHPTSIDKDFLEDVVDYVSNRAYICLWERYPSHNHHKLFREMIKSTTDDKTDDKNTPDLYEISGCLLRLALWPTDYMWTMLAQYYKDLNPLHYHYDKKDNKIIMQDHKFNDRIISNEFPYQIAINIRCGDHSFGDKRVKCNHDPLGQGNRLGQTYWLEQDISECAKKIIATHVNSNANIEKNTIFYITSDNYAVSRGVNESVNYPNTMIAPQACTVLHVDGCKSNYGTGLVILTFFSLSMSDILIAQTYDNNECNELGITSGFPRYSIIYGLKSDPLRSTKHCERVVPQYNLSMHTNGNWECLKKCLPSHI